MKDTTRMTDMKGPAVGPTIFASVGAKALMYAASGLQLALMAVSYATYVLRVKKKG